MITFDGWSGSGKTVQATSLAHERGINAYHWEYDTLSDDSIGFSSATILFASFNYLCGLYAQHNLKSKVVFTLDECYFNLMRWISIRRDWDEAKYVLGFYMQAMEYQFGGEPFASFYLDVPYVVATNRAKNRNDKYVEVFTDEADLNDPETDCHDKEMREAACFMSDNLPFFHIIDGTQPIHVITEECNLLI